MSTIKFNSPVSLSSLSQTKLNPKTLDLLDTKEEPTYSTLKQSHARCKEHLQEMISIGEAELGMKSIQEDNADLGDQFDQNGHHGFDEKDIETRNLIEELDLDIEEQETAPQDCSRCEELQEMMKSIQVDMINIQEDANEYKEQYNKIQKQGAQLYHVYEVNLKMLSATNERLQDSETVNEELTKEIRMVKEEYNRLYTAYNELVEQYEDVSSSLQEKKNDCVRLSNNILELVTENNELKDTTASRPRPSGDLDELQSLQNAVLEREEAYKEACEYIQKIEEEMKAMESAMTSRETETQELVKMNNYIKALESQNTQIKDDGLAKQQELDELRQTLTSTNQEVSFYKEELTSLKEALDQSNNDARLLQRRAVFSEMLRVLSWRKKEDDLKQEVQLTQRRLQDEINARAYVDSKRKALQQDITSHQNELQWLKEQLTAMKKDKEELTEFIEEERSISNDLTASLELMKKELEDKVESQTQECRILVAQREEMVNQHAQQIFDLEKQLSDTTEELAKVRGEKRELEKQIRSSEQEIEIVQTELVKKAAKLAEAEDLCRSMKTTLHRTTEELGAQLALKEELLGVLQLDFVNASAKLTKAHSELEAAMAKCGSVGQEKVELARKLRLTEDKVNQQTRAFETLESKVKTLEGTVEVLRAQSQAYIQQLTEAKDAGDQAETEKFATERKYVQSQANLARTMRELCEARETCNTYRLSAARAEGKVDGLEEQIQQLQMDLQREAQLADVANAECVKQSKKAEEAEKALLEARSDLKEAEDAMNKFILEKSKVMELMAKLQTEANQHQYQHQQQQQGRLNDEAQKQIANLTKKKTKLSNIVNEYKNKHEEIAESQRQLKQYLLLYKEKADEKQALTSQTIQNQTFKIQLLQNKLRHTQMVLLRYRDILETEPELEGVLQSLNETTAEIGERVRAGGSD